MTKYAKSWRMAITVAALAAAALVVPLSLRARQTPPPPTPLVTGKIITPVGTQTNVGSFPANLALSPDGRFVIVTNIGARAYVSVLSSSDGSLVSQVPFQAPLGRRGQQGLYYGLAFGKTADGKTPVYASRGSEEKVSILSLDNSGMLTDTGNTLDMAAPGGAAPAGDNAPAPFVNNVAGIALNDSGNFIYAAGNCGDPKNKMNGIVTIQAVQGRTPPQRVVVPGYPYALVATRNGGTDNDNANDKVYVTSEQRGLVAVINPRQGRVTATVKTGEQPMSLLLNRAQSRLYVANAGSDTVSEINTVSNKVSRTIPVRPTQARGLHGATPSALALSPDEKTLYVTLADMNAVAVVSTGSGTVRGYIPTGWYPTGIVVAPGGSRLFVSCAKGVKKRNPNDKPVVGVVGRPTYIENIIEGTVAMVSVPSTSALRTMTAQVLSNNRLTTPMKRMANPGIQHVIYIIKENRTYDQVLGDLPQGNGDKSLVMFGRNVTPNQHALSERFVLLDNFYCAGEVSGDGWPWSTTGIGSENVERNVVYNYTGHNRPYDFEGTNNSVPVNRMGIPDVARPASGYLWDLCARGGKSYRNYGCFMDDPEKPRTTPEQGSSGKDEYVLEKALIGHTDPNFRPYDTTFADSEAWKVLNLPAAPRQRVAHGAYKDPSRMTAFKREFAGFVKRGNLPAFMIVRLGRDHTAGTSPGIQSPRAMVADNDYAVGQMVETVSRSPYWTKTAIFILEDDGQNGQDHVDAHRSTAYVISPYIQKGTVDSRFYNTDSMIRTMESLLGLPPMNQYDAIATPFAFFKGKPVNAAPYRAILPAKSIVGEVNQQTAYRAKDSARLFNPRVADSVPDNEANDILWHAIKGNQPMPAPRYSR